MDMIVGQTILCSCTNWFQWYSKIRWGIIPWL